MSEPAINPGILEKIRKAETPEEVEKIVGFANSTRPMPDQALRRINRAAVARKRELSKL